MSLKLQHISRSFGEEKFSLHDISFEANSGEVIAILGESGSGKTTLLRLLAGFDVPDSGVIIINEKIICDHKTFTQPEKRNFGLVFQEYALFPHLNVEKNILFGAKSKNEKAGKWLDFVGLPGIEKRFPHELSGGQQQRVAIARSLASEPDLLLLDEPFSNLDDTIKTQVREEIRSIIHKAKITTLFVTHDTEDCLAMADKILVLNQGKNNQFDTIKNIYHQPVDVYTARLFGPVNELSKENKIQLGINDKMRFIRDEDLMISTASPNAVVKDCRFSGQRYYLTLEMNGEKINLYHGQEIETGTTVCVAVKKTT